VKTRSHQQGPNQHNIAAMLQRGFHVPGAKKEVFYFERGAAPKQCPIKKVGAADYFYSGPPDASDETLDEQITKLEGTEIGGLLTKLKNVPIDSDVEASEAARLVAHFAPRAAHIREVLVLGIRALASGAADVFTNELALGSLLGFNGELPSDRFREHFGPGSAFAQRPEVQLSGIPLPLVERMTFTLAKENFGRFFEQQEPVIREWLSVFEGKSDQLVRDSHNKALAQSIHGGRRLDQLSKMAWRIEAAPTTGAILPDCVAIAAREGEPYVPYMTAETDALATVVFPISSARLLVGSVVGASAPNLTSINDDFARCSHRFYIAARGEADLAQLSGLIGERSDTVLDEAVGGALADLAPKAPVVQLHEPDTVQQAEEFELPPERNVDFRLGFDGWQADEQVQLVAAAMQGVVGPLSRIFSFERLDGVTFAANYAQALLDLDRGVPGISQPQSAPPEGGLGIAMAPAVLRDGVAKRHIVAYASVALALIGDDTEDRRWAVHVLAYEFALVNLLGLVERQLPGAYMQPHSCELEGFLFRNINSAIEGYVAARSASMFAPQTHLAEQRDLLIRALEVAGERIPRARFDYRYHGDLEQLLSVAMPAAKAVLSMAADVLGHAEGEGISSFDDEGKLETALQARGLRAWFDVFAADLNTLWSKLGEWSSFDEFLAFNRHVERIVWQFGLVPWQTDEGELHVQVPIATDAVAMLEATARGVPLPVRGAPKE
jgi:hypothetical protein